MNPPNPSHPSSEDPKNDVVVVHAMAPQSAWKRALGAMWHFLWPSGAGVLRRIAALGGIGAVVMLLVGVFLALFTDNRYLNFSAKNDTQHTAPAGTPGSNDPQAPGSAGQNGGQQNNGQPGQPGQNQNPGSSGNAGQNGSNNTPGGNNGGSGGPGGSSGGGANNPSCAWPRFPDASCTGVPAGTALTTSGSLNITADNTVIDGKLITGNVIVRANNVTIKRSKILPGNSTAIRVMTGNVVVEDVEIDGQQANGADVANAGVVICCNNYTLKRVNIHRVYEGPRVGNNVTIEDSYIHHLVRCTQNGQNCHIDVLQATAGNNIVVRHNTLLAYNDVTNDPLNASFIIKADTGPINNVLVERNYMNGGNYTIYAQSAAYNTSNVTIRDNHFGRNFRYGPKSLGSVNNLVWSGNVWADNKQIIP